jgi:hypothetical protein
MATLRDIALNDRTAVEALASGTSPLLAIAGTAADPTGTAAATPEDTRGALMATLDPYYAYRQNAKQRRIKAVDDIYAAQESRLREQRVGLTKGERLLETLAAFGQPVSGGMGEALANAARVTTARNQSEREADRARQDKLAELSLAQKIKLAEQSADYDKDELDYLIALQKGKGRILKNAGLTKIGGRDVPVLYDEATGEYFIATPGTPGGVTAIPPPAGAAPAAKTPVGAAPVAGAPPTPGAALPTSKGKGAKWEEHIGETVDGAEIGLVPGSVYMPTTAGPGDPLKGSRTLSGNAALLKSGGAYERGSVNELGEFKPFNEKDRLPTLDEYRANLSGVRTGLEQEQVKLNQIRQLRAKLTAGTTGLVGAAMKYVPGSAALALRGTFETALSAIALDRLGALKLQSSTGASGLGSVTEKELKLLEAAIAKLDQNMSMPDLLKAAGEIEKHYAAALRQMRVDGQEVARKYQRVKGVLEPEAKAEAKVKTWNPKLDNGRGGFE